MKNFFLLLGAIKLCLCVLGSCSTGDAAMAARMLGGSSQALVFLNCKAVSQDEIEFVFSRAVTVKNLNFDPELSIASVENGSTVRVKLAESPQPGRLITVDLLAEDERRNSINVLVTLRARNDRMPNLVINEICTEYASNTRKSEFIEFKMRSAGNLGAMRVVIVGNSNASQKTIFEFSPVEVRNGDYVVLHLRTLEPASKDEYGSNLAESGGANSSPTARDFWIPGNTKLLHKTAIVYVIDQDDRIINAVMISENPSSPWPRDFLAEAADHVIANGAWNGNAVSSTGTTNTRTICRNETAVNTNSAADWYVTVTSGATPGRLNNPGRYQ